MDENDEGEERFLKSLLYTLGEAQTNNLTPALVALPSAGNDLLLPDRNQ